MMNNKSFLNLGPFAPNVKESVFYSFYADETTRFLPFKDLPSRLREQHQLELNAVGKYQQAFIIAAQPKSHVALFSDFRHPKWHDLFQWHYKLALEIGLDILPQNHMHFFSRDNFYAEIFNHKQSSGKLICCGYGFQNVSYIENQNLLKISQQGHSKFELARNALDYNIPIPKSLVIKKSEVLSKEVHQFFDRRSSGVIAKFMGMGGATNTFEVKDPEACHKGLSGFDSEFECLLQEKLNLLEYKEMAVDIKMQDDTFEIDNVRQVLVTHDQYWHPNIKLKPEHLSALSNVVTYMRQLGFTHPQGYTFGIDFFIKEDELLVGEINARWTSGLVSKLILYRLKANHYPCYAISDVLELKLMPKFQNMVKDNLYRVHGDHFSFGVVFVSFSPSVVMKHGQSHVQVWFLVIGDLHGFVQMKNCILGEHSLSKVNEIDMKADLWT